MTAEPSALAEAARAVVDDPGALPRATWPRVCALLGRQAVEAAVEHRLAASAPGLERCSRATQLTCLPWYVDDPAAARRAHQTWAALSHACHHHAYDLAPTAGELRVWLDDVDRLVADLAASSPVSTPMGGPTSRTRF